MVELDTRVNVLLASVRTPFFDHLFYTITSFGYWPVVASGTLALSGWLWYRRQGALILPLAISLGSCEILTLLGKLAFHRPRPDGGVLDPSGFSFPSGHASISVAFYGFAIYIAMRFVRLWSTRINLLILGLLIAFLIGFSRLYLGVHYPSDVLAGYLVGTLGLMLGISATHISPVHVHRIGLRLNVAPALRLTGAVGGLLGFVTMALIFNVFRVPDLSVQPALAKQTVMLSASPQSILKNGETYASSIIGIRRAPINVLFVARDIDQVRACLIRSGWLEADPIRWHNVPRAYYNVLRGTGYPTAPLSLWFWGANPQTLGLVQPGKQGHVFDRSYLRVWATNDQLNSSEQLFVATVGQEKRAGWNVVPQPLTSFNRVRHDLNAQLKTGGVINHITDLPYPEAQTINSSYETLSYDGLISLVDLIPDC